MTDTSLNERLIECACQNCDWRGPETDVLPDIPHFHERVSAGEICPVGECPECGALCHYVEEEQPAKRVIVEVSGGVAEVTHCPDNVEVEIIDHDNLEAERDWVREAGEST